MAYEDSELHRMLACFGPDGRNCCYYPSGAIMMLTSEHGGTLFDEVKPRGGGGWMEVCHEFITLLYILVL